MAIYAAHTVLNFLGIALRSDWRGRLAQNWCFIGLGIVSFGSWRANDIILYSISGRQSLQPTVSN
jgi:hypothetical protein